MAYNSVYIQYNACVMDILLFAPYFFQLKVSICSSESDDFPTSVMGIVLVARLIEETLLSLSFVCNRQNIANEV